MNTLLDIIGIVIFITVVAMAIYAARRSYRRNKEERRKILQDARREYFQREGQRAVAERRARTREQMRDAVMPPSNYLDESIIFVPTSAPAPYCAPPVVEEEPCHGERYTSGGSGDFGDGGATGF